MAPNSTVLACLLLALPSFAACSSSDAPPASPSSDASPAPTTNPTTNPTTTPTTNPTTNPPTNPQSGPPAGYPDGHAAVPAEGQTEDVSNPTTVIGTGTADSCTGADVVAAVAK